MRLLLLIASTTVVLCFHHDHCRRDHLRILPNTTKTRPVPVVLWHGMGDICCFPFSMGRIAALIEENVEGVYVKSLMLGGNIFADLKLGIVADMNEVVNEACELIRNDYWLQSGYNAIGFSQAAQFLRAVAQRCPYPPMKNLISVGGQQQGTFVVPYCPPDYWICDFLRKRIHVYAYKDSIQKKVVQAQYWHDPLNEDEYRNGSIFLADINNELFVGDTRTWLLTKLTELNPFMVFDTPHINQDYKKNLLQLENLLLVMFNEDTIMIPKESAWFGYYKEDSLDVVLSVFETKLYQEDRIGLRELYETGRLHFLALDGEHMTIDDYTFKTQIIDRFLK